MNQKNRENKMSNKPEAATMKPRDMQRRIAEFMENRRPAASEAGE